jgi:UDP-N-acetyl-D-mannosaminouronate:lipid I N-acetyl-D-mannosaminouronosyltransferase
MSAVPKSPLHLAARHAGIPSRVLCGFTTFAPPDADVFAQLSCKATGILVALNAEKLARADPRVARIVDAHVGYPDGIGVVLALRRGGVVAPRIAGADLWLRIVDLTAGQRTMYLVGGTAAVVEQTARRLEGRYPLIQLAYRDGYLTEQDQVDLEADILRRKPGLVLVAMGSPRQEILMERLYTMHPALYLGLGGSFDVFVGKKPRAPRWVQSAGLEWAYQFIRNPRRLRRLPAYLRFAGRLAVGRF